MENSRNNKSETLIVHAITKLDLGGAQKVLLSILTHLKKRKYNVLLICGEGGNLFPKFKETGIDMLIVKNLKREINPLYDIKATFRIISIFNSLKLKYGNIIVHTHTPKAGIIVRLSAYFAGIKEIYHTIHGWGFHKGQNPYAYFTFVMIEKLAAKITIRLIAVSKYVKKLGIKYGIGKKEQYLVIKNEVETKIKKRNRLSILNKLNINISKKVILQVSSLKPAKSPIDFLKIAYRFSHRKDIIFIIAGGGKLKSSLMAYIEKYNLNNILLLDWYNDVESLYRIADICTLTSISEGMPLTILEAISYNIPIIATDIGPNKEILKNYKYLCKPHDINCFISNINKLINNAKKINYNYTKKKMLCEYEALYENYISD